MTTAVSAPSPSFRVAMRPVFSLPSEAILIAMAPPSLSRCRDMSVVGVVARRQWLPIAQTALTQVNSPAMSPTPAPHLRSSAASLVDFRRTSRCIPHGAPSAGFLGWTLCRHMGGGEVFTPAANPAGDSQHVCGRNATRLTSSAYGRSVGYRFSRFLRQHPIRRRKIFPGIGDQRWVARMIDSFHARDRLHPQRIMLVNVLD